MLRGVDPVLTGELLKILDEMGHALPSHAILDEALLASKKGPNL